MITVRKLKVRCEDKSFYDFLRSEQREQNKALNLAIGYIHTSNILKSNDSGAETKILKSIVKLEDKIKKLNDELNKEKITDTKREKTLKAIETTTKILEGEKKILEEGKEFRIGLDKKFNEIYIDKNNMYHVLKTQTNVQYMRTLDLVKQKVSADYSNNFIDIVTGKISLMNYKQDFPLMIDNRNINLFKENDKYYIRIMLGYELEIVLGQRINENILELKSILDKIIEDEEMAKQNKDYVKQYRFNQSSIQFDKNNNVIFNLTFTIPQDKTFKPVEGRVLGVDLGVKYPAYMCLSDDTYKREHIGSINDFLKVRTQMQNRRRELSKALSLTNGGKGRNKKTQALKRLSEKERNFVKTYNHTISKRIVDFAKKHKCEYIHLEKLTKDGFNDRILRNWSYYELQTMIEYKADRIGIKVKYINPSYTSQKCSKCGHIDKENRQTQEKFVCTKCGFELNADHNAAINIARATE